MPPMTSDLNVNNNNCAAINSTDDVMDVDSEQEEFLRDFLGFSVDVKTFERHCCNLNCDVDLNLDVTAADIRSESRSFSPFFSPPHCPISPPPLGFVSELDTSDESLKSSMPPPAVINVTSLGSTQRATPSARTPLSQRDAKQSGLLHLQVGLEVRSLKSKSQC